MGTKRIGLARIEAMLENLKREINWTNQTTHKHGDLVIGGGTGRDKTVFEYNYITCGYPIVQNLGNSADGVLATEDRFGMLFFGPENELYPVACCSIGAYTVAGKAPQVDGAVAATDAEDLAAGFDIQMDCESAVHTGLEMVLGGGPMGGVNEFTVGTHAGHIDATFFTADWTDFDGCGIGLRKVEDFNDGHVIILQGAAAGDGIYTDFAAFGAMGDTNLEIMTDLNNSGRCKSCSYSLIQVLN